MPKFEEKESFTHKLAKELLRKWLAESWTCSDNPNTMNCSIDFINQKGESQSVNWRAQYITLEYPITKDFPMNIDETHSCKKNKECFWQCEKGYRWSNIDYCPCLKCEYFDKSQILYIVDLAIGHKGLTSCIIEVSHKNPISDIKAQTLRQMMNNECGGLTAFEIEAHHILGQIKKPKKLYVRSF